MTSFITDPATATLVETILRLLGIALVAALALRGLRLLDHRLVLRLMARRREPAREAEQKAKTLAGMLAWPAYAIVLIVAIMMGLRVLGFDVTPLIASAGIAGIAIGFGAQALVRDLLNGFFIISEDQFAVDDIVRIGDFAGQVERLTPRITQLRNLDGALITIPNGEIKSVVNQSKQWSRVNLDVQVPLEADVDEVSDLLVEIGRDLHADPDWQPLLLEEPQVLGVEQLGERSVTLKVVAKTQPTRQFEVARELRRRIKRRFREQGLDLPLRDRLLVSGPLAPQDTPAHQAMLAQLQSEAERTPASPSGEKS
jgi:small conductance mechanosensitive channel